MGMTQSAICRGSMRRDVRLTAFSGRGSLPLGPGPPVGAGIPRAAARPHPEFYPSPFRWLLRDLGRAGLYGLDLLVAALAHVDQGVEDHLGALGVAVELGRLRVAVRAEEL